MARRDIPLAVEIPRPEDDRPAWGKVGIIAAVGFVIGIAWPKLTHTHIAPSPPNENASSAAPAASASVGAPAAPVASAAPSGGPTAPAGGAASPVNEETVLVGQGSILRCRDGKGEAKDECGALLFDPLAVPRIKQLAKCPSAMGLSGKLSIGFDVDFKKKAVHVQKGKSTTLPRTTVEGIMKCASQAFANLPLDEVPHEHQKYTLFYAATFYPPGKAAEPAGDGAAGEGQPTGTTTNESPASGTATIGWDVAVVRDAPKSQTVVGRIIRGAKVKTVGKQGDWYHIQFGSSNKEGWVYRGALGL